MWRNEMIRLEEGIAALTGPGRPLSALSVSFGTAQHAEHFEAGLLQEQSRNGDILIYDPVPLPDSPLFDLASLTKLFTALLTLRLWELGKLDLYAPISILDPRFVHLGPCSFFDLLTYQISLRTPERIDEAPTREEALSRLFSVSPVPPPPVRLYSDINAMVVSRILEQCTGTSYMDALRTYVLRPLGMHETFACVPEKEKRRCLNYRYEHRLLPDLQVRDDPSPGLPHDPKALLLQGATDDCFGHAGLFSTREDMQRLCQGLLSFALLPRKTLLFMAENRPGHPNHDGTHTQYLGCLCFSKHPVQYYSEMPRCASQACIGLSGFTGNHLAIDPARGFFTLYLGNRVHCRLTRVSGTDPRSEKKEEALPASSVDFPHMKDPMLNDPIGERMKELGWL